MKNIEPATVHDLNVIQELNTLLKIVDVKDFYWNTKSYIASAISENRCFIIKSDSMILGAMIMESRHPEEGCPGGHLAIGTLSVRPECRKNGIGLQLVTHAKEMAEKEQKRLKVESFLEFRQLDFYRRMGFKEAPRKSYQGCDYHVMFFDPIK